MLENDNDPYDRQHRNSSRLMTLGLAVVIVYIIYLVVELALSFMASGV